MCALHILYKIDYIEYTLLNPISRLIVWLMF